MTPPPMTALTPLLQTTLDWELVVVRNRTEKCLHETMTSYAWLTAEDLPSCRGEASSADAKQVLLHDRLQG